MFEAELTQGYIQGKQANGVCSGGNPLGAGYSRINLRSCASFRFLKGPSWDFFFKLRRAIMSFRLTVGAKVCASYEVVLFRMGKPALRRPDASDDAVIFFRAGHIGL